MPRGEFSVVIAGLGGGVRGRAASSAPLATAYVLITVVAGPMLARLPDYRVVQDDGRGRGDGPPARRDR